MSCHLHYFSKELFAEFEGVIKAQFSGAGTELEYDIGDGETWAIEKGELDPVT